MLSKYGMWYLILKLSKKFYNESVLLYLVHHWGQLTSDLRVVSPHVWLVNYFKKTKHMSLFDIFVRIQNILSCWSRSSLRLRLWRLERGEAGQPASGLFSLTDPFYSSKRHPLQVHVSTHGATLLSSPLEKEVILVAVRTHTAARGVARFFGEGRPKNFSSGT